MRTTSYAAATLAALLLLAGCGDDSQQATPTESTTPTTSAPSSSAQPTSASASPSESATTEPADETAEPTPALLTWEPTGRAPQESVTRGGPWTVVVDEEGSLATVDGPTPMTIAGDKRFRINQVLLDAAADGSGHLVVVLTDTLEEQPAKATIVDLASGTKSTLGAKSDVAPATGGTWALGATMTGAATLAYPAVDDEGAYCLATADLTGSEPAIAWCAAQREGFTNVAVGPAAISLMSFDDARPSCRTLGVLGESGDFVDWAEPTPCKGWQAVAAESLSVWTEVPKENNVETALAYAATPDRRLALGKAAAGSLTWCAGAAYFVRDPEGADEPARLLRVTDAGAFQTVYESKATGDAFLSTPRCGGDRITVSAYSSAGDEQVSAALE